VLLVVAIERAHILARGTGLPSEVVAEAVRTLGAAQAITAVPIPGAGLQEKGG